MYWATTPDTILILHELTHMNARARARHRVAAASLADEQRHAHEAAAERHGAFAQRLADRLTDLGAAFPMKASLRATSDVQTSREARIAVQLGRVRLLARYEQALAEPMDPPTHELLAEQYDLLQAETQTAESHPSPALT